MLKSLRLRSKSQRNQNQVLKLPRNIMLVGNNDNNPTGLFVARLVTTNLGASSQSPMSPTITISMRGY
jgi:hypothetical protein